jgi:membrane-bound lytic murein transglycosylase D
LPAAASAGSDATVPAQKTHPGELLPSVAGTPALPHALAVPPSPAEAALFPRPDVLKPAVSFWTDVFQKYSENDSVVHAMDDPARVYAVLQLGEAAATMDRFRFARYRAAAEREQVNRIAKMLKHIDALRDTPDRLSSEERRIYALFSNRSDPRRFRKAIDNIRVQRGLRERTEHALDVATGYWPTMERTFQSYGLPPQLTRLPLVESSFNLNAYSKDGAAGIWQFIPSSARIYMRLNEVVDDRRDPWLSTDAAARHLRDDYEALHDWPLAVTAYNHGRGGIARGLITVRGTGLADLIERYRNPNFGFASRNFYAEFLAATDVARNFLSMRAPATERAAALRFDVVRTNDYVRYDTLRRLAGVDEDTFRELNPAYRPEVVAGRLLVPPGHEIRVPAGTAPKFLAAYAALPDSERLGHQREYFVSYRVQRGDSIGKLARRYRTTADAIRTANALKQGTRIHIGDVLRIPPRGERMAPIATASALEPEAHLVQTAAIRAPTAPYREHRVRAGQTLSDIALRYGTSVDALRELNSIREDKALRAGTTLKIPRDS